MDLVLQICDDFLLDKVWATLVPLSAFPDAYRFSNGSLPIPVADTPSTWFQILTLLPRPSLPPDYLESIYSTTKPITQMSAWPRAYIPRQLISLSVLTLIGINILYFLFAWLSYKYIFNHDMMRHPRFLKDQIKLEIQCSVRAFPGMTLLTLPWFQAEVMGYSKLYDGLDTYGYLYLVAQVPLCVPWHSPILCSQNSLFFIDSCYLLITVSIGSTVGFIIPYSTRPYTSPITNGSVRHSYFPIGFPTHDAYLVPTPFASHAFHPVDGYLQSVPYHLFIFLFPLHRIVYLVLFVLVNFWSIFVSSLFLF